MERKAEDCKRLWVEEAARRYQQLKAGKARSIASEYVFAVLKPIAFIVTYILDELVSFESVVLADPLGNNSACDARIRR